jgi:hypothetical protein
MLLKVSSKTIYMNVCKGFVVASLSLILLLLDLLADGRVLPAVTSDEPLSGPTVTTSGRGTTSAQVKVPSHKPTVSLPPKLRGSWQNDLIADLTSTPARADGSHAGENGCNSAFGQTCAVFCALSLDRP